MYYCSVCNSYSEHFLPFGVKPRPNAQCPNCGSLERHRADFLFMRDNTTLINKNEHTIKLFHPAPESCLYNIFSKTTNIDYYPVDLIDAPHLVKSVDLQEIPYSDNFFDAIYCSHVLEHVPNDQKAMQELFRVLKPKSEGGWAILQVPLSGKQETLEESWIDTDELRTLHYGQYDHLRYYGFDYKEKLERAGFAVNIIDGVYFCEK